MEDLGTCTNWDEALGKATQLHSEGKIHVIFVAKAEKQEMPATPLVPELGGKNGAEAAIKVLAWFLPKKYPEFDHLHLFIERTNDPAFKALMIFVLEEGQEIEPD